MSKSGSKKFVFGLLIGAAAGVLLAPKKGSETRRDIKVALDDLLEKVKEIDINETKEMFISKIEEIKDDLEDLDKEQIKKMAEDKLDQIKDKITELYDLAKEKGTPTVKKMVKDVSDSIDGDVRVF